jgi:hypothetical protein
MTTGATVGAVSALSAGLGFSVQTTTVAGPLDPLLQFGAVGVFAFLLAIAVRVLFKQQTDTLERERARADQMSAELSELRDKIQERYLITLEQASSAIREAIAATRTR